jgi:hypothetical protein
MQLPQHVHVPFKVEFADAVVRDRERLGARIGGEVEIFTLDGNQVMPIRLDDAERKVQPLGLLDSLVAGDDAAVPVDKDRAAGAIVAQGTRERLTTTVGATIGVLGIKREVEESRASSSRLHVWRLRGVVAREQVSALSLRARAAGQVKPAAWLYAPRRLGAADVRVTVNAMLPMMAAATAGVLLRSREVLYSRSVVSYRAEVGAWQRVWAGESSCNRSPATDRP